MPDAEMALFQWDIAEQAATWIPACAGMTAEGRLTGQAWTMSGHDE
jgi:hypothetical protein